MPTPATVGPAGAAADAAREVAAKYYSPALLHHCVRSFVVAVRFGSQDGIAVDEELLFVAAMLHDVALSPELDTHATGFDTASGAIAWIVATGLRWSDHRRERLVTAVVAHMRDDVDVVADPEGHLLERSTTWDISGGHQDALSATFVTDLLAQWPRLGIAAEFAACLRDQADRKPESSAGRAVRGGITERILTSPLDDRAG